MVKVVTLLEIEKIFAVTDALGISREALQIPLKPRHPGAVSKLASGKIEIIVESEDDFDTWLETVTPQLEQMAR